MFYITFFALVNIRIQVLPLAGQQLKCKWLQRIPVELSIILIRTYKM